MKDTDHYEIMGLMWGFLIGAALGFILIIYSIQIPVEIGRAHV